MNIFIQVIRKEFKELARERLLIALIVILLFLLGLSFYFGWTNSKHEQQLINQAQETKQQEWIQQADKHPHIAAHYGTYVFKPKSVLSIFDPGLDSFVGTSVYLEAHYQHEFMFRPAQEHSSMIRFGQLNPAVVLQILLPLLIIFLTFNSITKEKERGTLKLLTTQGISNQKIVLAKVSAYMMILVVVILPGFILMGIYASTLSVVTPGIISRFIMLTGVYFCYIFVFLLFSVFVSLKSSSSKNSLLALLSFWFLFTVIIPKTAANIGESLYPAPSFKEYKKAISKDIETGMDNDGSSAERVSELENKYLNEFKVESIKELPINFEGIKLQASEEYNSKVNKHHKEQLSSLFHKQNNISTYASLINPYIAIRNISMALSTSDLYSFNHFQNTVSNYRMNLIKVMNDDMAYNTKYGEFFEYKAGKDLWDSIPPFSYSPPSIKSTVLPYLFEISVIVIWCTVLLALINISSKKFKIIND